MKVTKDYSLQDFIDEFKGTGYEDNFSNDGLELLYDYLDDFEEMPYQCDGIGIGIDIVAIACDWTEYSEEELIYTFEEEIEDMEDMEDYQKSADIVDYLNNLITVLTDGNTFLVAAY